MSKDNIVFIGLDTHKVSTEVAHIEDQRGAKTVHHGKLKPLKLPSQSLLGNINLNIPMRHCIFLRSRPLWLLDLPIADEFRSLLLCRCAFAYP